MNQILEPEPTVMLQVETMPDKKPERKALQDTKMQILVLNHP